MTESTPKFISNDYQRFFEKIVFNQRYSEVPIITSRICGANSVANNITSTRAIEIACGINPSSQTEKLRDMLLYAQIIQSHTLYLYLEILPYFTGVNSLSELQKDHQEIFKNAVCLKNFADNIIKSIGGRSIHPISNVPGGFTAYPTVKRLKSVIDESANAIHSAKNTLSIFASFDYPILELKNVMGAIHRPGEYIVSGNGIWTSEDKHFVVEKYKEHLLEELQPHSTVKYGRIDGKEIMAGPLARLALNKLDDKDVADFVKSLNLNPDYNNPFNNIIASAIELYYFTKKAIKSTNNLLDKGISIEPLKLPKKFSIGTACCESPDGTLIHSYKLNDEGNIINCDIVTPSVFNLPLCESNLKLLNDVIKNYDPVEKDKITKLLFRSYRLCKNCGSH